MDQTEIDKQNAAFWSEMCGSTAADLIGVRGTDVESLKAFDAWYFSHYPYLDWYVRFPLTKGKKVLEVGLGYGSVSQKLAEHGADLTAVDIAPGPVNFLKHRLAQSNLKGNVLQGSVLKLPFEDNTFDMVVSIGCIHHTGDIRKAISELVRVLKPCGRLTIMAYNATSYLQNIKRPLGVLKYALSWRKTGEPLVLQSGGRRELDENRAGEAPPHTDAISAAHLSRIMDFWCGSYSVDRVNAIPHWPVSKFASREWMLKHVGPWLGLDVYAIGWKRNAKRSLRGGVEWKPQHSVLTLNSA